ncbi:MAG: SpoVG family protein [Candidatus Omnitrophica bacterium]|nr:SpoVG family protein [Candidatus Omnitrophota bacterium]MDD5429842.1 SpoVG family protein [Candidatus Omnitrophota bacterium]
MEITEVRVSLRESEGKRLKAYATVTFDNSFVVRNIKVIEGNNGLFVAMPARKLKQFCPRCGKKIDVGSQYCNYCGVQLPISNKGTEENRQATHQDLAHPINQEFRDYLQSRVLDAYHTEKAAPKRESLAEEKAASEGKATL